MSSLMSWERLQDRRLWCWCVRTVLEFFSIEPQKERKCEMAERKAVIKSADMSEDMQQDAVDCASQALEKYNVEKVPPFLCPTHLTAFTVTY
jgi:hypothetical protein